MLEVILIGVFGFFIGFLLATTLKGRKSAELTIKLENILSEYDISKKEKSDLEDKFQSLQLKVHNNEITKGQLDEKISYLKNTETRLCNEIKELKSELVISIDNRSKAQSDLKVLQERLNGFKDQHENINEAKLSLTKEFENLAHKIFDEKGKTFTNSSQTSIDSMLKPFREQIESFQKRVNDIHSESISGNTALNKEIEKVLNIGLKMSVDANNLTSALKGDSQQRGAWGEAQLRRTLEMSGLVEDAHYEVQRSFKDESGKQKQTDYLIKLPDNKHIIIDSKVTLNAYDRVVSAKSEVNYNIEIEAHIKAVKSHIDDLASKDYTNVIGMKSPNFVLMFMPIEPAYIEALKNNKDLFEYGYKKGIVLVSHTTLIPILRTVSNLWMIEKSNTEASEITSKAGDIYNQVCIIADRLSKLGITLGTVSKHYNSTVKALVGQQGLHGKVDRFSKLSSRVNKSMPELDAIHVDYEVDRLTLIAEPVITKDNSNED